MKFLFSVIFCIILIQTSKGKLLTRCELAKKLLENDFPRDKLEQWVCLIEAESGRVTSKKGGPNFDGSYDWGIFQINDKYWCLPGVTGGDCNMSCESLLHEDISNASKCAKRVYRRQGFTAWYGWRQKCQAKLPDLAPCRLNDMNMQKTIHSKQNGHVKKNAFIQFNRLA